MFHDGLLIQSIKAAHSKMMLKNAQKLNKITSPQTF